MISSRITLVIAAAGVVAGAFLASPELRAYAANTVGSIDIIDGSIQSVDIGNGQIKAADLGSNSVTSVKIKDGEVKAADIGTGAVQSGEILDGTITKADLSDSLLRTARLMDDANGNAAGWNPDDAADFFVITDSSVTDESDVFFSMAGTPLIAHFCSSVTVTSGSFAFICDSPPENGRILNYVVVNSGLSGATANVSSDERIIRK